MLSNTIIALIFIGLLFFSKGYLKRDHYDISLGFYVLIAGLCVGVCLVIIQLEQIAKLLEKLTN